MGELLQLNVQFFMRWLESPWVWILQVRSRINTCSVPKHII